MCTFLIMHPPLRLRRTRVTSRRWAGFATWVVLAALAVVTAVQWVWE